MKPFTEVPCSRCHGHGIVNRWDAPEECPDCDGKGFVVRYNDSGVLAKWPGGPLIGREPKPYPNQTGPA